MKYIPNYIKTGKFIVDIDNFLFDREVMYIIIGGKYFRRSMFTLFNYIPTNDQNYLIAFTKPVYYLKTKIDSNVGYSILHDFTQDELMLLENSYDYIKSNSPLFSLVKDQIQDMINSSNNDFVKTILLSMIDQINTVNTTS